MKKQSKKKIFFNIIFILLPIFLFLLSLGIGQYKINSKEIIFIILKQFFPIKPTWSAITENLIIQVRMPRIIATMIVGSSLAVSGVVFQGLFKNPLASPYTLGVSNGSSFGAALAILIFPNNFFIQLLALLFGIIAVLATFIIGGKNRNSTVTLVLGGIITGSFFSALVSLIKFVADPFEKLPTIVFWLMGSLATINNTKLLMSIPLFIIGLTGILFYRWRINVLSIGDEEAMSYGIDVKKDRFFIILFATILTSNAVSMSGVIGWIGLVIPHFTRVLVGSDFRKSIPLCISLGASYLLLIDNICRTLSKVEIPLGVVTALIGTPFFAYFILRERIKWI